MNTANNLLKLALPKGRIYAGVVRLLQDAGLEVSASSRSYRPRFSLEGWDLKILKPQSVAEMLDLGSRDLGFTGADWVAETNARVVELLDTQLDPVRLVAAAPSDLLEAGKLPKQKLVVASEYQNLCCAWLKRRNIDYQFVKSHGATEVFPPDDADCIVDNTATGSTLRANSLEIVDELMNSSTRLFASIAAMDDPIRRRRIEAAVRLVRSVLEARKRVMLEINVDSALNLDAVVQDLPSMGKATVSQLQGGEGFAVKAAVPRSSLPGLIPRILAAGGSDLVVSQVEQIIVE